MTFDLALLPPPAGSAGGGAHTDARAHAGASAAPWARGRRVLGVRPGPNPARRRVQRAWACLRHGIGDPRPALIDRAEPRAFGRWHHPRMSQRLRTSVAFVVSIALLVVIVLVVASFFGPGDGRPFTWFATVAALLAGMGVAVLTFWYLALKDR